MEYFKDNPMGVTKIPWQLYVTNSKIFQTDTQHGIVGHLFQCSALAISLRHLITNLNCLKENQDYLEQHDLKAPLVVTKGLPIRDANNVEDEILVKNQTEFSNYYVIFEMQQNLFDHAQKPICLSDYVSIDTGANLCLDEMNSLCKTR